MIYQINGYGEDPWEQAVNPGPESLKITQETWNRIQTIRQMYAMRFIRRYGRHYSDGGQPDFAICWRTTKDRFGYKIVALHGYLKPKDHAYQEKMDAINFMM